MGGGAFLCKKKEFCGPCRDELRDWCWDCLFGWCGMWKDSKDGWNGRLRCDVYLWIYCTSIWHKMFDFLGATHKKCLSNIEKLVTKRHSCFRVVSKSFCAIWSLRNGMERCKYRRAKHFFKRTIFKRNV